MQQANQNLKKANMSTPNVGKGMQGMQDKLRSRYNRSHDVYRYSVYKKLLPNVGISISTDDGQNTPALCSEKSATF